MAEDLGKEGVWELPPGRDAQDPSDLVIRGRFIGLGSSEHGAHKFHAGEYAERGGRCGACRWFETRIFRLAQGGYLIYNVGATIVPGERDLVPVEQARGAHEVVELYTRRRDNRTYLTAPSARALAQAAEFDEEMDDAWVNRVVQ